MLNTNNTTSKSFMDIADSLRRRLIRYIGSDGQPRFFGLEQAGKLADYFEAEKSANSVTYDAEFRFEDHEPVNGTFTITRNGDLICKFAH